VSNTKIDIETYSYIQSLLIY